MAEIDLEDNDLDTSAMAAAMGFSGFGSQNPTKKRKFNPNADAATSTLPKKPAGYSSTGANTAPLGQRRPMTLPPPSSSLPQRPGGLVGNAEEIDLEDGEVNHDAASLLALGDAHGEENGPAAKNGNDDHFAPNHHRRQGGRNSRSQGHPDTPWWENYYDQKCNENPWEELERQRGLSARGDWIPRRPRAGGPGGVASARETAAATATNDDVVAGAPQTALAALENAE